MKKDVEIMKSWRYQSPSEKGFFEVISPQSSDCKAISVYRLNLCTGDEYILDTASLEMNGVVISGGIHIESDMLNHELEKFDSFYLSGGCQLTITCTQTVILYIAGAQGDCSHQQSVRIFDWALPIGDIHQVHGSGRSEREVMFTLPPDSPAKHLICGLTWSHPGSWTSWPPHQHENDLEEVYCYFDMDNPKMGLHLSYLKSGEREELVAHPVQSGTMVLAPRGYHPTVAMPGTKNAYFWALAAFNETSKRYDIAKNDIELIDEL